MTGTPGAPPGGTDYRMEYRAELPEVMGRKLGLTDAGIALGMGKESYEAKHGAGTWQSEFQGALDERGIPTQGVAPWKPGGLQEKAYNILDEGVGEAYTDPKTGQQTVKGLESYLNPYQSYVTQGIENQFTQAQNQANIQASQAGAFGGARQGIQAAELGRQQAEAVGSSLAQGYGQAQQLRMQDVSNLMQVGEQGRQLTQQEMDAQYRAKIQGMYEPYQRLGFVSDIMQGAPTSASSLAMATTPQANPLAQAVGAGISGLALYQGFKD